jgi:hypothetical protein
MSTATDRLRFADATMTKDMFADHGKIGAGDSGIGEMDSPSDAEGIVLTRNALPAIIEVLRIVEEFDEANDCTCGGNPNCPWARLSRARAALEAI